MNQVSMPRYEKTFIILQKSFSKGKPLQPKKLAIISEMKFLFELLFFQFKSSTSHESTGCVGLSKDFDLIFTLISV